MEKIKVHLANPQKRTISKIIETLNKKGLVLLPGDTSYFIATKIGCKQALEKLNRIKQTSKRKFYSIMFKDFSKLSVYTDLNNQEFSMIKRALPGPYTFICKANKNIPKIMLQKRKEVGIRIPNFPFLQTLLEEFDEPILVSTATNENDFFEDPENDSPTWLNQIDLLVDGDFIPAELTTVVRFEDNMLEIMREGKGSTDIF